MKILKKAIIFILLAALALTSAACAGQGGGGEVTTAPPVTETAAETTTEPLFKPADINYKGYKFRIAENQSGDWTESAFVAEQNGEVLNDSIYTRNQTVNELYGVELVGYKIEGGRNSQQLATLTQAILAGDDTYDISYIPGQLVKIMLNTPEYIVFMSDIPTIDLTNPWWDADSIDAMTIGKHTLVATGDMVISMLGATNVVLFNKKTAENFKLGDVYKTVYDGKWTFDLMQKYAKDVSRDTDGDGQVNTAKDDFGISLEMITLPHMILGSGEHLVTKESDGSLKFALKTEKAQAVIEKFMDIVDDKKITLFAQDIEKISTEKMERADVFAAGRCLFHLTHLQGTGTKNIRSAEIDFGVIPFPKWDDAQERYLTPVNEYWSSWIAVPATNSDVSRTGNVMEALGYYSTVNTTPAFIDTTVTVKNFRDEESADMLEFILGSRTFDMGCYFNWGYNMLSSMAQNHTRDFASTYASNEATIKESIQKTYDAVVNRK